MSAKERITVTISGDILERIDEIARLRDESRSATIERMLERKVLDEEEFVETLADPVKGFIYRKLLESPAIIEKLAALVGDSMSAQEKILVRKNAPGALKAAAKRRDERKTARALRLAEGGA